MAKSYVSKNVDADNKTIEAAETKINRAHISYPDGIKLKIEQIMRETDKTSTSEVFKNALLFYVLAFEEHKKGSDLIIRNKNGETERIRLFL